MRRGLFFKNLYLAGSPDGKPQVYPISFAYIDDLSSWLYSPVDLKFAIEQYGGPSPTDIAINRAAAAELHMHIRRSNADQRIMDCVTWGLVKGNCYLKVLWNKRGLSPQLVQPEFIGVYNENITSLDDQEAFVHSTYYTETAFWTFLSGRADRVDLFKKAKSTASPTDGSQAPGQMNALMQVIVGGGWNNVYTAGTGSGNASTATRNVANWLNAPTPNFDPKVLGNLIRLDELWVKDNEHDDWTTLQLVGSDCLITSKGQHRNLFADMYDPKNKDKRLARDESNPLSGHHPFIEITPNPLDGYAFGRSELCNVGRLQEAINTRIEGIDWILRKQENPPKVINGDSVNQRKVSQLNKPGGWMSDTSPNFKVQELAPTLPEGLFETLHEYEAMYDKIGGFTPTLRGRGEAGVRSQAQAGTLTQNAAPRFKDRALLIERQVEEFGGLTLDILKAKVSDSITAWVMPDNQSPMIDTDPDPTEEAPVKGMKPVVFSFHDIPDNARVSVAYHSSSPVYGDQSRNLAFALHKAGATDDVDLIKEVHPPNEEELIANATKRHLAQAAFIEAHPELAEKGKKKR